MNKGILAAIGAYILWGLFPIYWRLLEEVPAIEILANRMVWSLFFVAILLTLQKEWRWLRDSNPPAQGDIDLYPGCDPALCQLVHLHLGGERRVCGRSIPGLFHQSTGQFSIGGDLPGRETPPGSGDSSDPCRAWGGLPDGELWLAAMDIPAFGFHLWDVWLDQEDCSTGIHAWVQPGNHGHVPACIGFFYPIGEQSVRVHLFTWERQSPCY